MMKQNGIVELPLSAREIEELKWILINYTKRYPHSKTGKKHLELVERYIKTYKYQGRCRGDEVQNG